MGDEITQPAQSAEFLRAKVLQEALRRGSKPALLTAAVTTRRMWTPAWDEQDPTVQKAYLEQLVECAPEAISILDVQHRITRINSEFSELFGFSPEEALGKRPSELIVPAERTAETDWIKESIVGGQKITLETRRQRKDGSLVDVSVSCAAVTVDGAHVGYYVLYRDIEESKRA